MTGIIVVTGAGMAECGTSPEGTLIAIGGEIETVTTVGMIPGARGRKTRDADPPTGTGIVRGTVQCLVTTTGTTEMNLRSVITVFIMISMPTRSLMVGEGTKKMAVNTAVTMLGAAE